MVGCLGVVGELDGEDSDGETCISGDEKLGHLDGGGEVTHAGAGNENHLEFLHWIQRVGDFRSEELMLGS